jgi:hypothetical protein
MFYFIVKLLTVQYYMKAAIENGAIEKLQEFASLFIHFITLKIKKSSPVGSQSWKFNLTRTIIKK